MELTFKDKVFYKIAEKLYTVTYYCLYCDCLYHVAGAMPKRHYFCDDCGMELLK